MQTADCRLQTVQTMQTEYFFFLFLFLYLLLTRIGQLYIGVFVYAQAALAGYVTVDVL